MGSQRRLSICYIVPGHHLLSSAGPTRNVLSLAEALSQWADVTVAFRTVAEEPKDTNYTVLAIEDGSPNLAARKDDAAIRGIGIGEFRSYVLALRRFIEVRWHSYDLVLEKSWLLSGYVVHCCQRRGLPGVLVENLVRVWSDPVRTPKDCARYLWHRLTQAAVGRYVRQTPLIIAETAELKALMTHRWGLANDGVAVVELGVDHALFRPLDQGNARQELGIAPDATVLLYAGVLDQTHDLCPLIEAASRLADPSVEVHIVGDGVLRGRYEEAASQQRDIFFFHGRVPHSSIPRYIAAADVCVAPYDLRQFPNGLVAYSTLKIPEYMACARPVVSVPSGHILSLIEPNTSGFLLPNTPDGWGGFLHRCPSREVLRGMGAAAAGRVSSLSWDRTARAYYDLCQGLVASSARGTERWQRR